jgi:hypothetical protein
LQHQKWQKAYGPWLLAKTDLARTGMIWCVACSAVITASSTNIKSHNGSTDHLKCVRNHTVAQSTEAAVRAAVTSQPVLLSPSKHEDMTWDALEKWVDDELLLAMDENNPDTAQLLRALQDPIARVQARALHWLFQDITPLLKGVLNVMGVACLVCLLGLTYCTFFRFQHRKHHTLAVFHLTKLMCSSRCRPGWRRSLNKLRGLRGRKTAQTLLRYA